jgi:hypothetical protein
LPHWGSLVFDLFPSHPALRPTVRKMMENYDPRMNLYNLHGVTRYAEKSFPWANYWAARCLARAGDPAAHHLLTNALASTNRFAGIPERVFYHGELFNNWFLTGHASLVWAVHGMLATAHGNTLRLLGGAHRAWRDVEFDGIHAGEGLVVSARVRRGRLRRLKITNLQSSTRRIECAWGAGGRRWTVRLRPGRNRCRAG